MSTNGPVCFSFSLLRKCFRFVIFVPTFGDGARHNVYCANFSYTIYTTLCLAPESKRSLIINPNVMKALRTYKTKGPQVLCRVDFITDDSDWNHDSVLSVALDRFSVFMSASVAYRQPSSDLDLPSRFQVKAHPNLPTEIVLNEASRFIQTLKLMYEL